MSLGSDLWVLISLTHGERKQKHFNLAYCYSEFRISPHQANNNKVKKVKTRQYIVFSEPKWKCWTVLGFGRLGCQGELSPVPAGWEELPPLVEGGDPRGEHGVVFFKETQSTRSAGDVVSSQPLLQQVPGDVEARPSEAVDMPAQGGPRLPLVLLLYISLILHCQIWTIAIYV